MTEHIPDDVSPAGRDLREYAVEWRPQHPVVQNDRGEWVLVRHELVRRAALDGPRFSSAVSRFLQVPNGLVGTEYTTFRRAALDPFLSRQALAPTWRILSGSRPTCWHLCRGAPRWKQYGRSGRPSPSGPRAPPELESRLLNWIDENHSATRSGELARTARGGRGLRRHPPIGAGGPTH